MASARGLNAKYLGALFNVLSAREPSILLDGVRARWRTAKPADAGALAAEIAEWQKALWKFSSVGHIGKLNGPKAWMEPLNPLIAKQEVKACMFVGWASEGACGSPVSFCDSKPVTYSAPARGSKSPSSVASTK